MKIAVDYGYDIHSVEISDSEWSKIQAGQKITITGQGFAVEGEWEEDYWSFNYGEKGSLSVESGDSRQIYEGSIGDLMLS